MCFCFLKISQRLDKKLNAKNSQQNLDGILEAKKQLKKTIHLHFDQNIVLTFTQQDKDIQRKLKYSS